MTPEMYTSVRVVRTTMSPLRRSIAGLALDVARNPGRYPEWLKGRVVTVDDWINWQLCKQRRHSARAGAHKLAKKGGKR